jgi:hypothetical protein
MGGPRGTHGLRGSVIALKLFGGGVLEHWRPS